MEEKELIRQSLRGDRGAFETLFDRYGRQIKRLLIALSDNEFDSNDMLQDTFLKAFTNLDKYDEKYPFDLWLKTIARNTFLDYVRKNKLKNKVFLIDSDQVTEMQVTDGDENEGYRERSDSLIEKIDVLEDKYREVMQLRYGKGLDYKEIAEELGLTMSAVKTRLYRAKEKLKIKK